MSHGRRTYSPIPAEHREFTVKVNGTEVERSEQLLAAYVTKTVNKISTARLVYLDGAASSGDFPLSNKDTFVPGQEVEILAGPPSAPVSIFKGIVIRQSVKVRDPRRSSAKRRMSASGGEALTVGRKNAYFFDQKRQRYLERLACQSECRCGSRGYTSVTHEQQIILLH